MEPWKRIYIVRSTWLWGSTPEIISVYLEDFLAQSWAAGNGSIWNYFVESASRCFCSIHRYEILFKAIYDRSEDGNFPLQASRAMTRVLTYREDAYDALNYRMAIHFIENAVKIVCDQVKKRKFKTSFYQGIYLFLAMLRYRIKKCDFISINKNNEKILIDRFKECINEAVNVSNDRNLRRLTQETVNFIYAKGKLGIIEDIARKADNE